MREMTRETVKALQTARDTALRRDRRLQAIVRLGPIYTVIDAPRDPMFEYSFGQEQRWVVTPGWTP